MQKQFSSSETVHSSPNSSNSCTVNEIQSLQYRTRNWCPFGR